jgi:hypothetical protein
MAQNDGFDFVEFAYQRLVKIWANITTKDEKVIKRAVRKKMKSQRYKRKQRALKRHSNKWKKRLSK